MDDSQDDVLADMALPTQHTAELRSVNTLERLSKKVKRCADVVGIFCLEASITCLIGAMLLEVSDEWQMQHRYVGIEPVGETHDTTSTNETMQLLPKAA